MYPYRLAINYISLPFITMALASRWKLQLVARLDALHTCLPTTDCDNVQSALRSPSVATETDAHRGTEDGATSGKPTQDTHLDRYKRWKLGDAKIEELTSVRGELNDPRESSLANSAIDAVGAHAINLSFFARGKRGVLFAGQSRTTGAEIVVKFAGDPRTSTSSTAAGCWVETEAKWIQIMNTVGIGARLEGYGTGWLICERLEGQNIVEFLSTTATPATARWALREILVQCFTMDMMGINKEEMTHPTRHVIIHPAQVSSSSQHPSRMRCTFIDFEKCSYTKKPKNVTQVCQFISGPRMTTLLQAKGVTWDIHALRQQTKRYKLRVSSETFGELLAVVKL